jgi:hypothetical protein
MSRLFIKERGSFTSQPWRLKGIAPEKAPGDNLKVRALGGGDHKSKGDRKLLSSPSSSQGHNPN